MCFDLDSRPPIAPIAGGALDSSELMLEAPTATGSGRSGRARPRPSGAGIVILPDVRGLHPLLRGARAAVRRERRRRARDRLLRPDGGRRRRAATTFDYMPHVEQVTWAGLPADIRAAVEHLRAHDECRVGALFTTGFCFGGRLAFLTADARARPGRRRSASTACPSGRAGADIPAPADVAGEMRNPILGLFGGGGPGDHRRRRSRSSSRRSRRPASPHRLVTYDGAPAQLLRPQGGRVRRRERAGVGGDADVHPRPHAERDRGLTWGSCGGSSAAPAPGGRRRRGLRTRRSTPRTDEERRPPTSSSWPGSSRTGRRPGPPPAAVQRPILDAAGPGRDGSLGRGGRGRRRSCGDGAVTAPGGASLAPRPTSAWRAARRDTASATKTTPASRPPGSAWSSAATIPRRVWPMNDSEPTTRPLIPDPTDWMNPSIAPSLGGPSTGPHRPGPCRSARRVPAAPLPARSVRRA